MEGFTMFLDSGDVFYLVGAVISIVSILLLSAATIIFGIIGNKFDNAMDDLKETLAMHKRGDD